MFIATVLFTIALAAGFAGAGLPKVTGAARMIESAEHLGVPYQMYRVIGVAELCGVAGVLVGLAWAPLGIAAALALAALTVGACASHVRANDNLVALAPALLLGTLGVIVLILRITTA